MDKEKLKTYNIVLLLVISIIVVPLPIYLLISYSEWFNIFFYACGAVIFIPLGIWGVVHSIRSWKERKNEKLIKVNILLLIISLLLLSSLFFGVKTLFPKPLSIVKIFLCITLAALGVLGIVSSLIFLWSYIIQKKGIILRVIFGILLLLFIVWVSWGHPISSGHLRLQYSLGGRDFGGIECKGCDLSGANLKGADLSRADLSNADLSGADIRDVDFSTSNLEGAILTGAVYNYDTEWPSGFVPPLDAIEVDCRTITQLEECLEP